MEDSIHSGNRSRRSSISSTTSASQSTSFEKRPNEFRFVVEKEKRMGRSTTKILQIVPNTRSVLVMEGKTSRLTMEIPVNKFKPVGANKVKSEYRNRQRTYVFATNEDRSRFVCCLEKVIEQTDDLIKIDAPTAPVKFIECESWMGEYNPVNGRRRGSGRHYRGRLMITTYRILFCPGHTTNVGDHLNSLSNVTNTDSVFEAIPALEVPGLGILDLEIEGDQDMIIVHCKDLRVLEFRLDKLNPPDKKKQLCNHIKTLAFPDSINDCFPFGGRVPVKDLKPLVTTSVSTSSTPKMPSKTMAREPKKKKRPVMPERSLTSHAESRRRNQSGPAQSPIRAQKRLQSRHLSVTGPSGLPPPPPGGGGGVLGDGVLADSNSSYGHIRKQRIDLQNRLEEINREIDKAKNELNFEKCVELEKERKQLTKQCAMNVASAHSTPVSPEVKPNHHNRVRSMSEEKFYGEEGILDGFERHVLQSHLKEYSRLGLYGQGSTFQISDLNLKYKLCPSYPEIIIVPKGVPEKILRQSAEFRSGGRLPAVIWRNSQGLTIARSSQPRSGLSNSRSTSDEKLVQFLRDTRPGVHNVEEASNDPFLILDARPKINAIGNRAKGKGYENAVAYEKCTILFMGIENIHVMRDSIQSVQALCEDLNDDKWLAKLDASKWLFHLKTVLFAAKRVVQAVEKDGMSVLVHCSDGWDRTAQICALSELLLDKYYRTIEGFQILIQKEWLWFGHKFSDRASNYGEGRVKTSAKAKSERSPVFIQWLDCVHQIIAQFPQAFEFDHSLLYCVSEHFNSGRFGTFLYNNEKERNENGVYTYTNSLWDFIDENTQQGMYRNSDYQPPEEGETAVLWPSCTILNMQFWRAYFCRWTDDDRDTQMLTQWQLSARENAAEGWAEAHGALAHNRNSSIYGIDDSELDFDLDSKRNSRRESRPTILDDESDYSDSDNTEPSRGIENSSSQTASTPRDMPYMDGGRKPSDALMDSDDSSPSTPAADAGAHGALVKPKVIRAMSAGDAKPQLNITVTNHSVPSRHSIGYPQKRSQSPHRHSSSSRSASSPQRGSIPNRPDLIHSQSDTYALPRDNVDSSSEEHFSSVTSRSNPFNDRKQFSLNLFKSKNKKHGGSKWSRKTELNGLREENDRLKSTLEYYETAIAHKEVRCSSCGELVYNVPNGTTNDPSGFS